MNTDAPRASLPEPEPDFLAKRGPLPIVPGDLRRFPRLFFRHPATMRLESTLPAVPRDDHEWTVYTRDISRGGIGILTPAQLFPCERGVVRLSSGVVLEIVVTSCRYIAERCYEVGAAFQTTTPPQPSGE